MCTAIDTLTPAHLRPTVDFFSWIHFICFSIFIDICVLRAYKRVTIHSVAHNLRESHLFFYYFHESNLVLFAKRNFCIILCSISLCHSQQSDHVRLYTCARLIWSHIIYWYMPDNLAVVITSKSYGSHSFCNRYAAAAAMIDVPIPYELKKERKNNRIASSAQMITRNPWTKFDIIFSNDIPGSSFIHGRICICCGKIKFNLTHIINSITFYRLSYECPSFYIAHLVSHK